MAVVMKCLALADGQPGPRGQFLRAYNVRTGFSEWTPDPEQAMKFDSQIEAVEFYRQVLPSQPTRPWDGRPNRPLTAFAVEIGAVCDECLQFDEHKRDCSLRTHPLT